MILTLNKKVLREPWKNVNNPTEKKKSACKVNVEITIIIILFK